MSIMANSAAKDADATILNQSKFYRFLTFSKTLSLKGAYIDKNWYGSMTMKAVNSLLFSRHTLHMLRKVK